MRFLRNGRVSAAEASFNIGSNIIGLNTDLLLDCGSEITTLSMGCFSKKLSGNVIDILCDRLEDKYSKYLCKTFVASGQRVNSMFIRLDEFNVYAEDGMFKFNDICVNVILNKNLKYCLFGWDLMLSHKTILNNSVYTELLDFDRGLYDESIKNLNWIDSKSLLSIISDFV